MATWSTAGNVLQWIWICMRGTAAGTGAERAYDSERIWCASRHRGQSMIEYALIFMLVILGLIIVLLFLGPQIASEYRTISNNL